MHGRCAVPSKVKPPALETFFFFFSANNGLPTLETQAEVLGSLACAHLPLPTLMLSAGIPSVGNPAFAEIFDLLDENTID